MLLQIRVPASFLSKSVSPSKSPTKGGAIASVTGKNSRQNSIVSWESCAVSMQPQPGCLITVSPLTPATPVGSTKAGVKAGLVQQPVAALPVSIPTDPSTLEENQPVPDMFRYDPNDAGSFPPKPALAKTIDGNHGSHSRTFSPSQTALEAAEIQTGQSANDSRAVEMAFKHNRTLPLELFDNPETEVVQPETRIARKAVDLPGAAARSRYYNSRGEFAWAPCYVLAYDRCLSLPSLIWHESQSSCLCHLTG